MPEKVARRQRAGRTKQAATPRVGIVYLVGRQLLIDSAPLAQASRYGDHLIHEGDHISFWAELVKIGKVPSSEYEEFPRGRVAFDTKSGKFTLLADECILRRKGIVREILSRLHIDPEETETGSDSHYRCFRCLGQHR